MSEYHTRAQALAQVLQQHRVEIFELAEDYQTEEHTFTRGNGYIIPLEQLQARLIKAFMERVTTYQDSLFYDVSTWTLPLAFGVPYAEMTENPATYVGNEIGSTVYDGGEFNGGRSDYAYVMEWGRYFAPSALYKLQAAGVKPRLMTKDFSAVVGSEAMSFPAGTIIIPVKNNDIAPEDVHPLIDRIVREDHVRVFAASTGLTPEGPDLGSPNSVRLQQPEIALLSGSGTSSGSTGEVWHLLSERFRIPITLLDVDRVGYADLSRYNTLIMAGGSYGGVDVEKISEWVRNGGILIALGSAGGWLTRNDMVTLENKPFDLDSLLTDLPYNQVSTARGAQRIGGSIFEVILDPTHPLAYGYGPGIPSFRQGTSFFQPSETPGSNVGVYAEEPLLSGYITDELMDLARESAAMIAQRNGRGHIVLFMFNPNFRACWYGTNGLLLNSIFFGGVL